MNIKVTMDLGNSQSRVTVQGDKGLLAPLKEYFVLPNVYAVASRAVDVEAYRGTDSLMYNVTDNGTEFGIATGSITNEFSSIYRPQGLEQKHTGMTTALGITRVMIEVVERIAKKEGVTPAEILKLATFDIFLLMPPQEVKQAQTHFEFVYENGVDINVTFPYELKGTAKVTNITVLNEGLMGYMAASIDMKTLQPRVLNNDIRTARVMILDVGAGTTELLLVDNNVMIETSRTTIRLGVINIINTLKTALEAEYGFTVAYDDAEMAARTGYLKVGRRQHDVIDHVNQARKQVAGSIVASINNYLSGITMPLSTIEDLLVFGGGAINAPGTGLVSLGKYIKEPLSAAAKGAEFVNYDEYLGKVVDEEFTGDELLFTERTMNIQGGTIIAKVMLMKENA